MASRSLAGLIALWFGFVFAEPLLALHRCPMHDGVVAQPAHAAHHAPPDAAPRHTGDAAHHCTCLGECAAAAARALPARRVAAATATIPIAIPVARHVAPLTAGRRDHLLPFPHGPPLPSPIA